MTNYKSPKVDSLLIDVVEYAFIEWLARRKLYVAFRSNYVCIPTTANNFRDQLRKQIRHHFGDSMFGPASLISSAFPFNTTPEGYNFWRKHSDAWASFYDSLSKKS